MLCEESVQIITSIGDVYGGAVAYNILGQAAYQQGDYGGARRWSQQSFAIEEWTGNRWSMAYSITTLGNVAYAQAEYGEARRLFEQSLQIRQEAGDMRGVAMSCNRLGDTALQLREYGQAGTHYAHSLALFREIGNQWGMTASLINVSRLAMVQGHSAAALRILQEALWLAVETQAQPQLLTIMATFATLLRERQELALADELMPIVTGQRASNSAYDSYARRLLRWTWPDAVMTLEQALVYATAESSAHKSEAQRGESVPQLLRPKSKATFPAGLTAREVEVLRLVANGLTDKEVADTLVLSARTVSTHLTSIYGKLQVNSRSAAARFAVEHGLV